MNNTKAFDVSFNDNGQSFVTVGGDNTLRKFDIRDLTKSNILYDRDDNDPFVKVCWNKTNTNQISMISMYSNKIFIFDVRHTYSPLVELDYHKDKINNITWSPFSQNSNFN